MNPLDYSLCTQTVTVYRKEDTGVCRFVLENCYLEMEVCEHTDVLGKQQAFRFLLIMPGQEQLVFPGDRIVEGVGAEVEAWAQTNGFAQVEYATLCRWDGCICHTEAGRKVR